MSDVNELLTQVGSCPVCGAPVYVPSVWGAIIPPVPQYSCVCNMSKQQPELTMSKQSKSKLKAKSSTPLEEINKNLKEILVLLKAMASDTSVEAPGRKSSLSKLEVGVGGRKLLQG